jgi:hypothetical protein
MIVPGERGTWRADHAPIEARSHDAVPAFRACTSTKAHLDPCVATDVLLAKRTKLAASPESLGLDTALGCPTGTAVPIIAGAASAAHTA